MLKRHKKRFLVVLVLLIGVNFSLLSSYIVQSFGCGILGYWGVIDCGYYSGFPVPFAKFDLGTGVNNKQLYNPIDYFKYKYSSTPEGERLAKRMEESGNIVDFYLSSPNEWDFDLLFFLLNSVMWLAPIIFIIEVFI